MIVPNECESLTLQRATILWAPTALPHLISLTQIAANCVASTSWLPVKSALMYAGMLSCMCLHCETLPSWIFYVTTQACITGTWLAVCEWGVGLLPDAGGLSYDTWSNVRRATIEQPCLVWRIKLCVILTAFLGNKLLHQDGRFTCQPVLTGQPPLCFKPKELTGWLRLIPWLATIISLSEWHLRMFFFFISSQ